MSAIDLTTVSSVKAWLSSNGKASANDTDDPNIQLCITAASMYWLWRTGRGPRNNSVPTQSPFNQGVQYTETYDGNGKTKMFLRNAPILSIQSLVVNGVTIPQSTAWNVLGWVINDDGKSISIRRGSGTLALVSQYALGQLIFNQGIQNVVVQYTAGFAEMPIPDELQTIPGTPGPYAVSVNGAWLSNIGVKYFSGGAPLTQVFLSPSVGEYFVAGAGSYIFAAADQAAGVLISYNEVGTPPDVVLAATQMVAVNYRRKSWIDQKSQAMAHGAGTVSYRDWELPPEVRSVMVAYTRTALV